MNKISTLAGIIIIVAAAVILFGVTFAYQYFAVQAINQLGIIKPENQTTGVPKKYLSSNCIPEGKIIDTNPITIDIGLNCCSGLVFQRTTQNEEAGECIDSAAMGAETFSIGNQEVSLSIVGKNIEIKNKNTGIIIQKIPLNDEIVWDLSSPIYSLSLKNMVFSDNDINFDGYKDLQILISVPADNPGIFGFYIYNPSSKNFEADPTLSSLVGPNFDAIAKTITTYQSGGCAGGISDSQVFSFMNGGYVLTQSKEQRCCYPDDIQLNGGVYGITVNNYDAGKIISTTQETCPPQHY